MFCLVFQGRARSFTRVYFRKTESSIKLLIFLVILCLRRVINIGNSSDGLIQIVWCRLPYISALGRQTKKLHASSDGTHEFGKKAMCFITLLSPPRQLTTASIGIKSKQSENFVLLMLLFNGCTFATIIPCPTCGQRVYVRVRFFKVSEKFLGF